MTLHDRDEAAQFLAKRLLKYRGQNPLVLAIPRGAVRMGQIIAAALHAIREKNPKRLIAAIGVAPVDAYKRLQAEADEVVSVLIPSEFYSVSQFYENFSQTEDEEVIEILRRHDKHTPKF